MGDYIHRGLMVTGNVAIRPQTNDEIERAYDREALMAGGPTLPGQQPDSYIELAHRYALWLLEGTGLVTPLQPQGDDAYAHGYGVVMNGYRSFAVLPSGSKDNREEATMHSASMARLVEYMESVGWDEGNPLAWQAVEIERS